MFSMTLLGIKRSQMGRNLDRRDRCKDCLMKSHMCICSILHPVPTNLLPHNTFTTILMHNRETVTTTNTARMALKILPQSNLYLRGLINKPLNPDEILLTTHQPLYLYPTETSEILTNELIKSYHKPIQLIVPDGSWRQTRRFAKREPWLQSIPHIRLPDADQTLFFLRRRVKAHGISTFEAIARSLGIIETTELQSHMEIIFKTMIERTLKTRGKNLEQYL